ncbi:MAG: DUF3150 domain-containing protein [Pseudomonadota bacterium]|nr:DUF3150 domain-containing protein [Pseudomonadota bacterium]
METLERVVCINLDVHLYTGRRKLRLDDLKAVSGDQIPPSQLASLGAKRVCNPRDLDPMERIKKQAERLCEEVGMRFLRGGIYLVAKEEATGIRERLDEIMARGREACEAFLEAYEERTESWVRENPEWGSMIRAAIVPVDVVRGRLNFGYQVFEISNPRDDAGSASGLGAVVDGLGARLFREVAGPARKLWERSLRNRDDVTQKAVGGLRRLLRKLKCLSLVDPRVSPLVTWAEDGLDLLPVNGRIAGNDLKTLESIVFLLSDPDKTLEMAESLLYGRVAATAWEGEDTPDPAPASAVEDEDVDEGEGDLPSDPRRQEERQPEGWFY